AELAAAPDFAVWRDYLTGRLAEVLVRQERLIEAEGEARSALLRALEKRGRYSPHTANILNTLTQVIFEQGRFAEAETLARAGIDIYQKIGASPDSLLLAVARTWLGASLVTQNRWREALAEYEAIRAGMRGDPEAYQQYLAGDFGWAVALLNTGNADRALELLRVALERSERLGEKYASPAQIRGLLGVAYAAKGDRHRAVKECVEATRLLLGHSSEIDEETTSRTAQEYLRRIILSACIGLMSDIRGTPLERDAGIDAAAEAFRLAEAARGRAVQRALDASAARAAAKVPALADLVRREQDAKKQVSALYDALANQLAKPTDQQDARVVASLRAGAEALRRARQALTEQIAKEFPAYAELINPPPVTVEQARAKLRPGEALIAMYVAEERTYVWAIPHTGRVAFAAAPMGQSALEGAVATLRKALDPSAKTLGDIPEFDLVTAHRLYSALLEPVREGWRLAESLLVVPHGPLGQLPFSLLPTEPTAPGREEEPIFAGYRAVPWLIRSHAVTMLPSVTALATLRALPAGDRSRRPFVGFGDPYFSQEQARRAARRSAPPEVAGLATRSLPVTLRSSPGTQGADSSQLAMLPRLPETAEEILSMAAAMNADPTQEVFLGARANERAVKSLELASYRVVAFATHGLVPGELDGLTQPALALSAPEVAQVEGDGLLTMEEILGLRLNADWVVLSACNTASGKGAGAEAVSGLGRAFFYAGVRALLVSNWPVETTSARALTTDLFRRQAASPGLTRARALQQTMNWLIAQGGRMDPKTNRVIFSYAHPIFWAPFALVGDGGGGEAAR
ncbi:MAG: CHAT domain-containing protein, partial [Candidatus Rokubacteria bacterium]|nr:CHAT domain-containing protein [Candidatus Rokubacteria bacterium]